MTLKRIRADTEKTGPVSELCPCVTKLARLGGASRRMVLRIKIENDLFVEVVAELKWLAIGKFSAHRDTRKVGSRIAHR